MCTDLTAFSIVVVLYSSSWSSSTLTYTSCGLVPLPSGMPLTSPAAQRTQQTHLYNPNTCVTYIIYQTETIFKQKLFSSSSTFLTYFYLYGGLQPSLDKTLCPRAFRLQRIGGHSITIVTTSHSLYYTHRLMTRSTVQLALNLYMYVDYIHFMSHVKLTTRPFD